MKSQLSQKTNDKKSTNEIISRHLASNLHIGMSRDLTTVIIIIKIIIGVLSFMVDLRITNITIKQVSTGAGTCWSHLEIPYAHTKNYLHFAVTAARRQHLTDTTR